MRITIKDVARKAGYSITTVSLVLNNRPVNILESTREAIVAAANELGYRPNQLAKSMVTKKTNVLGLIISDVSNPFFSEIVKQVDLEANRHGYTIIIGESLNDPLKYKQLLEMFVDRQVDGIVVTTSNQIDTDEELRYLEFLRANHIPSVSIDTTIDRDDISSVLIDQKLGGYLATRHLLDLNHRMIGCLTGPAQVATSAARLEGYKQALTDYNIPFQDKLIYVGNFSLEKTAEALNHFLESGCTAIFALNDMMAFGLYRAAYQRNIKIPQDISIVGFDDILTADLVSPGLTTLRQPVEAIAVNAIDILNFLITEKDIRSAGRSVHLEPSLIVRESTTRRIES